MAMLQAAAGSPPYCTPPGHPGGRGRDDLPTRTVRNPEPQPIARKVVHNTYSLTADDVLQIPIASTLLNDR